MIWALFLLRFGVGSLKTSKAPIPTSPNLSRILKYSSLDLNSSIGPNSPAAISGSNSIYRTFKYSLSRQDIENAVFAGPLVSSDDVVMSAESEARQYSTVFA